jgi:hypothetical protein
VLATTRPQSCFGCRDLQTRTSRGARAYVSGRQAISRAGAPHPLWHPLCPRPHDRPSAKRVFGTALVGSLLGGRDCDREANAGEGERMDVCANQASTELSRSEAPELGRASTLASIYKRTVGAGLQLTSGSTDLPHADTYVFVYSRRARKASIIRSASRGVPRSAISSSSEIILARHTLNLARKDKLPGSTARLGFEHS